MTPPESNLEFHRRSISEAMDESRYHSNGHKIRRWAHLFDFDFAENGWPLTKVPTLKPIAECYLPATYNEAASYLISHVPWCRERAKEYGGEEKGGRRMDWYTRIFCDCPAEDLLASLGLSQTKLFAQVSVIQSNAYEFFRMDDVPSPYVFLEKIRLGFWHATGWGGSDIAEQDRVIAEYEKTRRILDGIRRFDFGHGMKTYADTASTLRWGFSNVNRHHYLDAHIGLNVCRGDEHLLTIAFTPTEHGIAIAQVQVKQKTGNRWLFYLGEHFLDYALERMHEAFLGEPLLLVSGETAQKFVHDNYTAKSRPSDDVLNRVWALYSRPLARFERGGNEPIKMSFIGGRAFWPLVRK